MADSTTNIAQISESQADKEVTANQNFDAASPSMFGARHPNSTGLNWQVYGGKVMIDGVITNVSNANLNLTANVTNYVEVSKAGVISANTTGFTPGAIPLYQISAGASTVSSYTDKRVLCLGCESVVRKTIGSPQSYALTAEEALAETIEVSGQAGVLFVPRTARHWTIFNNTSGDLEVTVSGSPATGVVIATTKTAIVRTDGTDVVRRVTADA